MEREYLIDARPPLLFQEGNYYVQFHLSGQTEAVDRHRVLQSLYRDRPLGVEAEERIGGNSVMNSLGDRNGSGFGLTAESGGQIDSCSDDGVVEVFGRAEVSNHCFSPVDTDADRQ